MNGLRHLAPYRRIASQDEYVKQGLQFFNDKWATIEDQVIDELRATFQKKRQLDPEPLPKEITDKREKLLEHYNKVIKRTFEAMEERLIEIRRRNLSLKQDDGKN